MKTLKIFSLLFNGGKSENAWNIRFASFLFIEIKYSAVSNFQKFYLLTYRHVKHD